MTRRWLTAFVLTLPFVGLLVGIGNAERDLAGASMWRIPVTGYDPLDPLRGRYIRFQYAWTLVGRPLECNDAACRLCLEGGGRAVRIQAVGSACSAPVDPRASGLVPYIADGKVQAATRLWVSEASAPVLDAQLRNRPMVAVARLTRSGRLTADRLEPAQSPPAQ